MILLLSLTLLKLCSLAFSESHFEDIYFVQTLSRQACSTYYEQVCSGWWLDEDCDPIAKQTCTTEYYTSIGVTTRCQAGWQPYPGNCDVPICNPACVGGQACINPNVCGCLATSGGLCSIVPCNDEDNCYPGTCDNTGTDCKCPPVFAEKNCIRILQLPEIRSCTVQLYDGSSALTKQVDCASTGVEPQVTWIHNSALGKILVNWEAHYVNPIGMPDRTYAPHVNNAPVPLGVTQASFNVSFSGGAGTDLQTPCTIDQSQNPPSIAPCSEERPWSEYGVTPAHNQTFNVSAGAQLGGHKDGSEDIPGSFFPPTYYVGDAVYRHVQFKFDLQPPTHCLTHHGTADCLQYAIYLDEDIRTNPTIEPKIYNWTDDGSGLVNYHIEVFYMQPTPPNHYLVNVGGPLIQSDINPSQNNFIFICTTPGVYAIELTVEDLAGNKARARELFIYNDNAELTVDPSKPIYIAEANPESNYSWITNIEYPQGGDPIQLTLIWTDHFKSAAEFNGNWGLAAEPWPTDRIDDRYEKTYGARTVQAITNMPNGIVGYSISYTVDQTNGGRGLSPDNWTAVEATKDRYTLSVADLVDGNALVVWVRCYDAAGSVVTEKRVVNVDTSDPQITEENFVQKSIDGYTSSVYLTIVDKAAGVKNISFEIYDRTLKTSLYTGSVLPQMRDPPPPSIAADNRAVEQPCTSNDTTCYCIPHGECYNYVQQVDIDHCWIDLYAGDVFEFNYIVTNLASLKSTVQTMDLGQLNDIPCRPSPGLSGGEIAGIVIGCLLGVLLIVILVFLIRIYVFKKPLPARLTAARTTLRNKFGPAKLDENVIYQSSGDIEPPKNNQLKSKANSKPPKASDIYVYSGPADEGAASGGDLEKVVISRKQLEMIEMLSEGRFAVVQRAYLQHGNETITVAAKSLRSLNNNNDDVDLLNRKIHVLSTLRPHANVVKYLGKVEPDAQEGPILLLELCEIPLKDWLDNNERVTSEVLENMLSVTYDIANGVQHLHANKIIHRRLAVRNVLLKEQRGGFVAKLIGFGPSKEDSAEKSEQVSVPIKWLAPETLKTINSQATIYNEQTDAWSFGITVWEIYSNGATPYQDKKSSDVKRLVMQGLTLTRPDDCPSDLFESVVSPCWTSDSNKRPTFSTICSAINRFRNGAEPAGYYLSNETSGAGYYDPSQMYTDQSYNGGELYTDAR